MGTIEIPKKREHRLTIQTGEEFETGLIDGKLTGLIIDSSEKVSITITSSLGYLIFHTSQHIGINYYAPRAVLQGAISRLIVQDQFDKFKLNESLNIRVDGPSSDVMIILRLD
jgi:hypothetical protein